MNPVIAHTLEVLLVIGGIFGFATITAKLMDDITARERAGCPHCQRMAE